MDVSYPTQPCFVRDQSSSQSHDLLSQVLHKQALVSSFDSATATTEMQHSSSPPLNHSSLGMQEERALAVAAVLALGKRRNVGTTKKRRRSSSKALPLRVLTADVSNFRQIVHILTGFPQPQPQSQSPDSLHLPSFPACPLNNTLPPHSQLLPFLPFNHTQTSSSLHERDANSLAQPTATPLYPFHPPPVVESLLGLTATPNPTSLATSNIEPVPHSAFSSSFNYN